jgi:hypothetical protein
VSVVAWLGAWLAGVAAGEVRGVAASSGVSTGTARAGLILGAGSFGAGDDFDDRAVVEHHRLLGVALREHQPDSRRVPLRRGDLPAAKLDLAAVQIEVALR